MTCRVPGAVLAIVMIAAAGFCADPTACRRRRALTYAGGPFYSRTFGSDAAPPRYLYADQETVEARLRGTSEENRRYAALLPLQLACLNGNAVAGVGGGYVEGLLRTISRYKWKDALPLLGQSFSINCPDAGEPQSSVISFFQRDKAAAVWLHVRIADMTDEETMCFLVSVLTGREAGVRPGMMKSLAGHLDREALRLTIATGGGVYLRESLVEYLTTEEIELTSVGDLKRAELLGKVLGKYALFNTDILLAEGLLLRIVMQDSDFNRAVATSTISNLADSSQSSTLVRLGLAMCRDLWNAEFGSRALRRAVRSDFTYSRVPWSPDTETLVEAFLKELNEKGRQLEPDSLIPDMVTHLKFMNHHSPLSPRVRNYLARMSQDNRYDSDAMKKRLEQALNRCDPNADRIFSAYSRLTEALGDILDTP